MNIKNRLLKLEQKAGVNEIFCRCGTPYLIRPTLEGEEKSTNICPECKLDIKPPTAKDFEEGRVEILEPRTNFTREEFEAYQEKYTMSRHITFEQYQAQNGDYSEY